MKAAYFDQFGGPDVLKYGDLPDPVPATDEIVVDVAAASVNAADWKFRAGQYARHSHAKFPLIPGRDFSGTISALGSGVGDLKLGDEVFGVLEAGKEGTYAEKLVTKAAIVAKKPKTISHVDAAAVALTGLTAVNSIADTQQLKKGETILIQGGAGGVAGFAIQFAKHLGARVITTTSAANRDYVRDLGADEVIDYNAQDFTKVVSGCDAVFDTVGGEVAQKSFAVLKPGGRAAFIASGMEAPKSNRPDVVSLRPPVGRSRAAMERVAELIQTGAVKPPAIKLYRLSEAAEAQRLSEGRHFRGKLVFKVR
jgi:NADPH:quinone reductase-like Zn-dependent oxidoreductase